MEYACSVWLSGLDLLQKMTMNIIFPNTKYSVILTLSSIQTPPVRRKTLTEQYFRRNVVCSTLLTSITSSQIDVIHWTLMNLKTAKYFTKSQLKL